LRTSYVVRRPVDNRYLVRERDRRRLRELGWVLLAALPMALMLIAYVWVNLELLHCGYSIHELEGRLAEQHRALSILELEEAYLTSAERLTEKGIELGLAPADASRLIHVGSETP
jgi:cell division protein FtsL